MKKKSFLQRIILLLSALCFFTNCGNPIASTQNQPVSNPQETPNEDSFSKGNMRIISSNNGIIASAFASNGQGCYEIFYRPTGDGNILYIDYATQSRIYLSNQVASERNSEADTSFLPSTIGGCYPLATENDLFLFKLNLPTSKSSKFSDAEKQGYIARYALNGESRKVLTHFEDNEVIADGCVAFDGAALYYLSYFIESDGASGVNKIARVDITTGEKTYFGELDSMQRHFIIGAFGNSLVLKSIINPVKVTSDMDDKELQRAFSEQQHQISLISGTGESYFITAWKQAERSMISKDDTMIFWQSADNSLWQQDYLSGEKELLYQGQIVDHEGKVYPRVSLSSDFYDNHILMTAQTDEDMYSSQRLAFDLKNRALSPMDLTENDSVVSIVAEGEETFLVKLGLVPYGVQDYTPDGQSMTTNMLLPELVFIPKEDYWNNIGNYVPLKDSVYVS